jgi:hypothetical protein
MGFGAGLEGRGGQFLQQLQEPQRQYQRQLENYNQQGTELGLRGLERAQREQEQKTRRAQEVSDREFAAEVDREARRLKLTDEREKALFQDALLAKRQREDDERQAKLEAQKAEATKKIQKSRRISEILSVFKIKPQQAKQIADYEFGDAELSPAVDKVYTTIREAVRGMTAGRSAPAGKPMAVLENGDVIPISKVNKEGRAIINGKPQKVVGYTGGGASTPKTAAPQGKKADPLGIR